MFRSYVPSICSHVTSTHKFHPSTTYRPQSSVLIVCSTDNKLHLQGTLTVTIMMQQGVRVSGLKRLSRSLHPSPVKPHPDVTHAAAVNSPLTLPPATYVASLSTFITPQSPSPTPSFDFTPPSRHKRMRRSVSPMLVLDSGEGFSSPHVLLTMRADRRASPAFDPPPIIDIVTDAGTIAALAQPSTHSHSHLPSPPQSPPPSPPAPPPLPPSSSPTTSDPGPAACSWTLADILNKGAAWSEAEYKAHRPLSFTGLSNRSWARLDAAIRRRRHGHSAEKWEVSFAHVCGNLRHTRQQPTEECSGDERNEQKGEGVVNVSSTEAMSALVERAIDHMQRQHTKQMRQFTGEWDAVMSRMRDQLKIEQ